MDGSDSKSLNCRHRPEGKEMRQSIRAPTAVMAIRRVSWRYVHNEDYEFSYLITNEVPTKRQRSTENLTLDEHPTNSLHVAKIPREKKSTPSSDGEKDGPTGELFNIINSGLNPLQFAKSI